MEKDLRRLAEECGVSDWVVGVDCTEPPCLLSLVTEVTDEGPVPSNITSCAAWRERFGDANSGSAENVLCSDGIERSVALVGPYVKDLTLSDPDDPWAGTRRLRARNEAAKDQAHCTAPVSLTVENRLGYRLKWVPAE
ncbi:MAG: hypothetical protein H0V89_02170 [Deltaproteobacteria bacterium]|nr:hypothetical protein [Deltaproteobacteria bacterium]